jgi:thiosulfate/3-mercaptopyruvate sulfurtransferase
MPMDRSLLAEPEELLGESDAVIVDCRFSLADPDEGRALYRQGHIPGAVYLDLNRDLSGPVGEHGGRHPLPDPEDFAATLANCGIGPDTLVIAYDDNRLAFAARLAAGGEACIDIPEPSLGQVPKAPAFSGYCDIDGLRALQAAGAMLVDSREEKRFEGLEEPIDPVAGHIPGAINRPWQGVTTDSGRLRDAGGLQGHWGDALEAEQLVVYCGSGVTACVNLFSLTLLGREDATLYAGSWSDWCSYL